MKLIYVHGRSQQNRNAEELRLEWKQAQAEGLQRVQLPWPEQIEPVMPFYGDELDRLVQELNAPLVEDVTTRGVERGVGEAMHPTPENQLRGELLREMAQARNITEEEIREQFRSDVAARGGDAAIQRGGVLDWEWIHSILKLLDRTPIGPTVIDKFTRDVSVYLTNRAVRMRINRIVREAIPDEACVIVAHSLGTIITYDVLQQLEGQKNIRLITVGSPLGIQAVKRNLGTLRMPVRVAHWYNAMDERDVVALYPLDQNCFGITPPIENKTTVDNPTSDHHGIDGYLRDSDVARLGYLGMTVA